MKRSKQPDADLTSKLRGILPGLFPGDLSSMGARLSSSVGARVMGFSNTDSENETMRMPVRILSPTSNSWATDLCIVVTLDIASYVRHWLNACPVSWRVVPRVFAGD